VILAVDVDYRENGAIVAGVAFGNWQDEFHESVFLSRVTNVQAYEPGSFYKREMPCIIQLLLDHNLSPDFLVIDGFVMLGHESRPGLGMYIYEAFERKTPIIGVAKTAFQGSKAEWAVLRGKSQKPLYVTAVGIDLENAKKFIRSMHGKNRIPTLLKLVDSECRKS
jgi:deoxyribonuclease V